jgi:hypothetical protein
LLIDDLSQARFPASSLIRLADAAVRYDVHPALRWAEPLVAAEFARVGRPALVLHAKDGVHAPGSLHFSATDDARPAQAVDYALRALDGTPWFGPGALQTFAWNLARALKGLAPMGPGGHFLVRIGKDHLHLEWNSRAPLEGKSRPGARNLHPNQPTPRRTP